MASPIVDRYSDCEVCLRRLAEEHNFCPHCGSVNPRNSEEAYRWLSRTRNALLSDSTGKCAPSVPRATFLQRLAQFHDKYIAYEAPESGFMKAIVVNAVPENHEFAEFLAYVSSKVMIGQIRGWLLQDGAQLRLGEAYGREKP